MLVQGGLDNARLLRLRWRDALDTVVDCCYGRRAEEASRDVRSSCEPYNEADSG